MKLALAVCLAVILLDNNENPAYRYTDAKGAVHIVGSLDSIPDEFKDKISPISVQTYSDPADDLRVSLIMVTKKREITMYEEAGKPVVDVTFNGIEKRRAIIDSGSQFSVITKKLARALRLNTTRARLGRFSTPTGSVVAPVVTVKNIKIGETIIYKVIAAVIDYPGKEKSSAIIGMNVLSPFSIEIDHSRKKLRLLAPDECLRKRPCVLSNPK